MSSLQFAIFSFIALTVCYARPSSQDERRYLTILSPRSSLESLVSSLHQSPFSSSSSSSASESLEADRSSLSLPSSLWANDESDGDDPKLSGEVSFPRDADSTEDESAPNDYLPYPIQNGLNAVAMEHLKNAIYTLAQAHVPSDANSVQVSKKRFRPSGFMGSRGKRIFPGLNSLLLAKYYKDAAKWKRQPHLGFHGSRG